MGRGSFGYRGHAVSLAAVGVLAAALVPRADQTPRELSNAEFWRLVTVLSEPGGRFAPQLMSNEDSAQFVIPTLETTTRGGVYVGVGSEQNFTYLAATRPALAFIVDIRRDNQLEHLMYKALFELSADRTAFVSRLFSRPPPRGLSRDAQATALFDAFHTVATDAGLLARTRREVRARLAARQATLTGADLDTVDRFLETFSRAGPDSLKGYGDGMMLTYAELMSATDLTGTTRSYLSSEARYGFVRDLQRRNLVVPVVGDFAGDKALNGIGAYVRSRGGIVATFYVSNVERYLFEQGEHGRRFYANVAGLPLDAGSLFVRSVTTDISRRLSVPIPDGPARWRTFVSPIQGCLDRIASGNIQTYRDLFVE